MAVAVGPNQDKPKQIESRRNFYDRLAEEILIDGIVSIERDHAFDDEKFRSGGIRLHYPAVFATEEVEERRRYICCSAPNAKRAPSFLGAH
jgi:hypothetical protein